MSEADQDTYELDLLAKGLHAWPEAGDQRLEAIATDLLGNGVRVVYSRETRAVLQINDILPDQWLARRKQLQEEGHVISTDAARRLVDHLLTEAGIEPNEEGRVVVANLSGKDPQKAKTLRMLSKALSDLADCLEQPEGLQ